MLSGKASRELPSDHHLIGKLEKEIAHNTRELMKLRHPNFGCVFKSGTRETEIAHQLLRFADLYTSRVENILLLAGCTQFGPRRRLMPHDISITPHLFMSN